MLDLMNTSHDKRMMAISKSLASTINSSGPDYDRCMPKTRNIALAIILPTKARSLLIEKQGQVQENQGNLTCLYKFQVNTPVAYNQIINAG